MEVVGVRAMLRRLSSRDTRRSRLESGSREAATVGKEKNSGSASKV